SFLTCGHHPLCIRQERGDRLFAIDSLDAALGTRHHNLRVSRRIGGNADDIESFGVEHRTPVSVRFYLTTLLKSLASSFVAAAASDEAHTRAAGQRSEVRAIHPLDALPDGSSGDGVGAADHAQTNDAGTVLGLWHVLPVAAFARMPMDPLA